MNWLFLGLGVLIFVLIAYDFALTAISSTGAGPITARLGHALWRLLLKLSGHRSDSGLLSQGGMIILVLLFAHWTFWIWAGNSLIFLAQPGAVTHSSTGEVAGVDETIYFVGYTISTLGLGGYTPAGGAWQLYAAFLSFCGITYLTVAITYFVPVVSNVLSGKCLAIQLACFGRSPQDMITREWSGSDFGDPPFLGPSLSQQVILQGQSHLVYPILNYFHQREPRKSIYLAIAKLDEVVTLLEVAVHRDVRPNDRVLQNMRGALDAYLETLEHGVTRRSDAALPLPELDSLRHAGIPLEDEATIREGYRRLDERRRTLASMLHHDGWDVGDLNLEADLGQKRDSLPLNA
ncbi:MAG: potassium channel family protein [Verrucomicrobiota bacterium JB022]|nr:potassium channel family protein [Verrucomicrobiota bacterium JB022]